MVSLPLRRFWAPEFMIRDDLKSGDIPGTKEAYSATFSIAWASITETFLIALISIMDTVMVSAVGDNAISAVGLVTQPRFIVQTLVLALNMAVTSITARRKGENNPDGAVACMKQSLVLCAVLSLLLSLVSMLFSQDMLIFAGAEGESLELANVYFRIILIGIPLNNISLTISSALRGIGHTKASMIINMSSNAVNLVFNYLLIGGRWIFPALGVAGAAVATCIGWGVGLVLAVLSVAQREGYLYLFTREGWLPRSKMLRSIRQVASGAFLEQMCMRIGFLAYAKVIAALGMQMFTAHQILISLLSLSFSFGEGFGIAASSLVGQNLGAKRPDLSIIYGKCCQRISFLTSGAVLLILTFLGRPMIKLFTSTPEIIEACTRILLLMGLIIFGQASQMIFMGCLRGAGDTKYTAFISLFSVMLIRPGLAMLLAFPPVGLGLLGAWLAFLADQIMRLVFTLRRFSSGKWMAVKL